ncbi:MAG: flagellar hook-basal body complex protein, partial [Lachnospiraceae bacterium]|nr:flagellar hook-basal body complex protein [Lachnospiraceae bacterium]
NIANVNTVGFKSSSVTFQDIMYQTTSAASGATQTTGGVNAKQVGLGASSGSVKVAIDSSGAAQSTGGAFDIKLTDTNSTNFFIVNNGSENLFTRAGSFYIDGSGNLAMTSTGYLVQGWQVDNTTGNIRKDLVSPLRILQPDNLTSEPEYTTNAAVSGVLDKNDSDVTSDDGYLMSLTIYDNLGYPYTAMFSVKDFDSENGEYTVQLRSVINSDNVDILDQAIDNSLITDESAVFGTTSTAKDKRDCTSNYHVDGGKLYYSSGTNTFEMTLPTTASTLGGSAQEITFTNADATGTPASENRTLTEVFGISSDTLNSYPTGATFLINANGELEVTYSAINYPMRFNTSDGTFSSVGADGNNTVTLNMTALGDSFANITVDFSKCLNYNNGGSSTLGMDRGTVADPTDGAGKKLGVLTGVSVSKNGEIFGSYDNGNTVLLGQIAVAQFANASGLESLGNNVYGQTLNSGEFDGIGVDVSADGGSMSTGQLEMSNVDLSSEFTEMITTQRGFQANSRIITVSDTLLEELTNLKR